MRLKNVFFVLLASLGFITAGCEGSYLYNRLSGKKDVKPAAPSAPTPAPAPAPAPAPDAPAPAAPTAPTDPTAVIPPAPPAEPAAPVVPVDASLDAKIAEMNLYMKCINRTGSRTADSYNRYLSWVNEQTGPTCQERYISYGLYSLYDDGVKTCQDAAMQVAASGPSYPAMEKSLAQLSTAYAQLVPLVKTAEEYYQQQDYKDDQCAKGKQLHPQLVSAFKAYKQSYMVLQTELRSVKEELDTAEIARLQAMPERKLELVTRVFMLESRRLVDTIPENDPLNFKPEAYLAAYAKVDVAYNEFNNYVTANPDKVQGVFWFSAFEGSVKNFFTKAKFLKRDLAEGKKAETRSLHEVISDYNRLIGDFNNVRFSG